MTDTLFRPEVIDAQRDRLAGTVIAATPPGARVYAALLAGVMAMLAALLAFGSFSTRERVKGVVAPDRGIARVYAPAAVEVRDVRVREGQRVAAGAPLVTVAVTQGRDPGGDGVAGQIREIDRQDAELARQQELARALGTAEADGLAAQRAGFLAEVTSLERQRALATEQARLADAAVARAGRLLREAAGTRTQLEAARADALARRTQAEALGQQIIAQREQMRRLGSTIAERRLGADRSAAEIAATRADLAGRRAALIRQDRLVLTAPVAGEVAALDAEVGQRAGTDSSLLSLIPAGSRMEVWLYAPSRAAGRVRAGQEVRFQFEAFPYQKYGAGRGTVVAVAASATDPRGLDPGLAITEPVYRLRVRVDRVTGDPAIDLARLRPGMALAADLVLEKRRLWEVFLDPVLKALAR